MERRMAAFAIDALLLLFVAIAVGAAVDAVGASNSLSMAGAITCFVVYHSVGLINRDIGVGRVVMAISVVSLKSGPGLSALQCIARPVVRLLWLLVGMLLAAALDNPIFICGPLLVDLALLTFHPLRQTVADLMCKTVVMNLPPLQPHRAPAGPMFSAEDAEFGPKPRKSGARRSTSTDSQLHP